MSRAGKRKFPDAVKVAPKTTKVVFENDKIRVLEERFMKGQKVAMHSHPPYFAYAVTRMKYKIIGPDGKGTIVKMKRVTGGIRTKLLLMPSRTILQVSYW